MIQLKTLLRLPALGSAIFLTGIHLADHAHATATNPALKAEAKESKSRVGTTRFQFQQTDLTQIVAAYSKVSGQRFVIDPSVRGKATILAPQPVSMEEAFSLLSSALATNGFAISEQGDTMVVMSARNAQRSLGPVVNELPPLKPERMATVVFSLKHLSADEINKRLRILPSKDGEMTPMGDRLIATDWVSNLHKIAVILKEVDQPSTAAATASGTQGKPAK